MKQRVYGTKHVKFESNLDGEEWMDIVGYEGIYQISNLGRIKSLPKKRGRFLFPYSYLLSFKTNRDGYYIVTLQKIKKNHIHKFID